jgi:hypothetical protein
MTHAVGTGTHAAAALPTVCTAEQLGQTRRPVFKVMWNSREQKIVRVDALYDSALQGGSSGDARIPCGERVTQMCLRERFAVNAQRGLAFGGT